MHTNQMNFWGFQHVKGAFDHNALVWEVVKNNLCKRNNLNLLYQNTMTPLGFQKKKTFRFVKIIWAPLSTRLIVILLHFEVPNGNRYLRLLCGNLLNYPLDHR
jgi:hypothetical protein